MKDKKWRLSTSDLLSDSGRAPTQGRGGGVPETDADKRQKEPLSHMHHAIPSDQEHLTGFGGVIALPAVKCGTSSWLSGCGLL